MQVNELRIGNYIHTYTRDKKIEHVVKDMCKSTVNGTPIEHYGGISLTEEWLLKFGFEIRHKADYIKVDFTSYQKDLFVIEDNNAVEYDGNELRLDYEFLYVHQLQNLYFALTGKELTCL